MNNYLLILLLLAGFACSQEKNTKTAELPIYGENIIKGSDTIHHTIGKFAFLDQDSNRVTEQDVKGKVHVADFFFTTCPSICIPMAKQMLRVHKKYQDYPNFMILSYSIDPGFDTVQVLKQYASGLGLEEDSNWRFLTGEETDVFSLGERRYFVTAKKDEKAPGGVLHSGAFILVDEQGRVRGAYDGTDPAKVDQLMLDIDKLLLKQAEAKQQ